jgi:hypothetical protein
MEKERLAAPPERKWTRADDYVAALVLRGSFRRRRDRSRARTEPEAPRAWLSTIPFLALLAALAMLSVAIILVAWPGRERQLQPQAQPGPAPAADPQEVSIPIGNRP